MAVPARLGGDFARLWTAGTVSSFGTAVTTVALPIVALTTLGASTFEVGLISAAGLLSWLLLGLPAGVWVERVARKPLLIACDLVRALVLVSVPVAGVLHLLSVAHLMVAALITGAGAVLADIAGQTYLPAVVAPDRLVVGNSRLQASAAAAQTGGPALGGLLVQLLGGPLSIAADVLSYLVSALLLSRIRTDEAPIRRSGSRGLLPQIREGLSHVWGDSVLRPLLLVATIVNLLCGGFDTLLVPFMVADLHLPPAQIGVLLAVSGVGGLVGAATGPVLARRVGDARAMVIAVVAGPVLGLLVPVAHAGFGLVVFGAGLLGREAGIATISLLARSFRQLTAPPPLLARITASIKFISWGVLPIGALLGGALGQAMGPRLGLWIISTLFLLTSLPLWLASTARLQRHIDQAARPRPNDDDSTVGSESCVA